MRADRHELSQDSRALVLWRPPWPHSPGSGTGFPLSSPSPTGMEESVRGEDSRAGGYRCLHVPKCPYRRPFTAGSPVTKRALHCTKLLHPSSELPRSKDSSDLKATWTYSCLLLQTTEFIHVAQVKGLAQPITLHYICFAHTCSLRYVKIPSDLC